MNATVITNLSFILFWLIVTGVILLGGQRWPPLATWRNKLLVQWRPALAIALIALVSSGLCGAGLLNLYVPAIFGQALLGLAVARSIAEETTYRLVALTLLWPGTRRRWLAIVLAAVIFALYHLTPLAGSYRTF